jgi:site-specific recombinase XerD
MDNNEVAIYSEIKKANGKTKLVETELKGKNNYYDNDNIVFYSTEQLKALLDGITNEFHKLAVLLMYETGARVEEIRELKFSDVESSGRIKVLTLKQRKKNKIYRYLKISDKLMALILSHRLNNKLNDNDYILAKKTGAPAIARKSISYILKYNTEKVLGKTYLDKAHPHALRHTRAIHLLDSGMNIMLLKNFLGHSNISNTLIYLKYSNADMAAAVDKANNFI